MMTFVNMDSEGLVILPTHRVVFGLKDFSPRQVPCRRRRSFRDREARKTLKLRRLSSGSPRKAPTARPSSPSPEPVAFS